MNIGMKRIMKNQGILRRILRIVFVVVAFLATLLPMFYFITLPRRDVIDNISYSAVKNEADIRSLDIDKITGSVSITTVSGYIWRSNPTSEQVKRDTLAKGNNKMTMQSQLTINYCDKDNRSYSATSYVNALDSGRISPEITGEGNHYFVTYNFSTGKSAEMLFIKITVEYLLKDGILRVRIPFDRIKENDSFRLLSISVLPYFGAGSPTDKGYMLIPDGNGALIDFNMPKKGAVEYNADIYGHDLSLKQQIKSNVTQPVNLPVIGIKNNQCAFLAIADEGDSLSSINASASEINTLWNNAYFSFRYREYDSISLSEMTWNERNIPFVGGINSDVGAFSINYCFLPEEKSDYVGMATVNRSYLMQKYKMRSPEHLGNAMYIDFPMSVNKIKAVAGLPINSSEVLTTFEEATDILKELKSFGVDALRAKLSSWRSSSNRNELSSSIDTELSLGGNGGLKAMIDYAANDKAITFFPSVNFTAANNNGGYFISLFQGSRNISGTLAQQYKMLPSTKTKDLMSSPSYLVNPSFSYSTLANFINRLQRYYGKKELGIAVDGYGELLYSDAYSSAFDGLFARRKTDRAGTQRTWQVALNYSRSAFKTLMINGANAYALPFATDVLNVPLSSGQYKIFTRDVPYLQIVLSGMVNSAATPINFFDDPDLRYLQCMQFGTYPQFCFTDTESNKVKGTSLNYLYNIEYKNWSKVIAERYNQYKEVYRAVGGQSVIAVQYENNQVTTTFSNSAVLSINYLSRTYKLITHK